MDDNSYTRAVRGDFVNAIKYHIEYKFAVSRQHLVGPIGSGRVLQVFNPWIERGITLYNAASIQKDALALQPTLSQYKTAKAKRERRQTLNTAEKRIPVSADTLERSINGFLRDFRLSQFYDSPLTSVECIDSIINNLMPINDMDKISQCIVKLTGLKNFVANIVDFFDRMDKLLSHGTKVGPDSANLDETLNSMISGHLPKIRNRINIDNIPQEILKETKVQISELITKCISVFDNHMKKNELMKLLKEISEIILVG